MKFLATNTTSRPLSFALRGRDGTLAKVRLTPNGSAEVVASERQAERIAAHRAVTFAPVAPAPKLPLTRSVVLPKPEATEPAA